MISAELENERGYSGWDIIRAYLSLMPRRSEREFPIWAAAHLMS